MRRVMVIRKDLNLKPGKLAAMVGHCCEAYWTNLMKQSPVEDNEFEELPCVGLFTEKGGVPMRMIYKNPDVDKKSQEAFDAGKKSFTCVKMHPRKSITVSLEIPKDVWNGYVNDIFTKTICEAKNLNQLNSKALPVIEELGLVEGVDWGYINDKCLTDLTPENEDGTTTIGMWFRPLPDEQAQLISKKFKLYGAFD